MIDEKETLRMVGCPPRQATHEGFYRAFEERFRGSRETILSRLLVYLPFIEPLKSIYNHPKAVDLGCGRGEWLELLTDNGFDAQGVDLDEGMLAACHERSLRATNDDAIAFLEKLPNDSQTIISGLHIAEHLPFPQLQTLVQEAFRVLQPAGLLILETPNPENIKVSSLTFYLDPTHRNPLPRELLSFLPQYYGFERVKIARLQENRDLFHSQMVSLDQVLGGASPDYAVIAQKATDTFVARLFDSTFEKDYGVGAHVLVQRFDQQFAAQTERVAAAISEAHSVRVEVNVARTEISTVQQEVAAARAEAATLRAALVTVQQEAGAARAEAATLRAALEAAQQEAGAARAEVDALRLAVAAAETNANVARAEIDRLRAVEQAREHAEARVAALLSSTSWKITAPLRGVASLFHTDPVRRRRLALVARVGQGSGDVKGPARLAVYGLGRIVARMPGGHGLARIVSFALPGPYRWLHTRYAIYRSITTSSVAMTGDSATSSQTLPISIYPQAARLVRSDLAAEEQAMLLRLRPRDEAA